MTSNKTWIGRIKSNCRKTWGILLSPRQDQYYPVNSITSHCWPNVDTNMYYLSACINGDSSVKIPITGMSDVFVTNVNQLTFKNQFILPTSYCVAMCIRGKVKECTISRLVYSLRTLWEIEICLWMGLFIWAFTNVTLDKIQSIPDIMNCSGIKSTDLLSISHALSRLDHDSLLGQIIYILRK